MQYFLTFIEGLVSFISPCMLPLLPLYVSYFGGGVSSEEDRKNHVLAKALFFVLGFSIVFIALGIFAGTLGAVLIKYRKIVNIICGSIVILLGISYLGLFNLPFFKGSNKKASVTGIFSAFLFGIIYSVSLTPCVGAFLGSALMMASSSASALKGFFLLLCYSAGLGIPFVLSALLLNKLRKAFNFIKKHYKVINIISGILLICLGTYMLGKNIFPQRTENEFSAKNETEVSSSLESNSRSTSADKNKSSKKNDADENQSTSENQSANTKKIAPDFTVLNERGEEVHLSDFEGKPVVANFWASWCPPCKAELPDFNEAWYNYKDDVEFLMIDLTDGERETVKSARNFIASEGYDFPIYFDTEFSTTYAYRIMNIPLTIFVNADGTLNSYHMGMMMPGMLETEIQKLLQEN